jgi:hypothetical protein
MKTNPVITQESIPDQTIELTIPANESRRISGLADRFYFVAANAPILVKTGIVPERFYTKGQGKSLPAPAVFEYAELKNLNAFAVTIELEWTFGDFIDRRFIVAGDEGAALGTYDLDGKIEPEETLAAGNLGNGSEVTFSHVPDTGYLKRRYVSISNNSATARLLLKDADDVVIGSVFPSQTNEFYHQDTFKLRNESGSPVDVKAYTCWEVDPYTT